MEWIKISLNYLNLSQEQIKDEIIQFFGDNSKILNKKSIYKKFQTYLKEHKIVRIVIRRKMIKEDNSDKDFDDNDDYVMWMNCVADIDKITVNSYEKPINTEESLQNKIPKKESLLIRNKESQLIETERTVFRSHPNGEIRPKVIKETYAKIPKTDNDDKEVQGPKCLPSNYCGKHL